MPLIWLEISSVWPCYMCAHLAQTVKCLPTMRETRVQSLGREDLLEKEMATYSGILAWKIPWMKEPGGPSGFSKAESVNSNQKIKYHV